MMNYFHVTDNNDKYLVNKNEIIIYDDELYNEEDLNVSLKSQVRNLIEIYQNFDEIEFKINLEHILTHSIDDGLIKNIPQIQHAN